MSKLLPLSTGQNPGRYDFPTLHAENRTGERRDARGRTRQIGCTGARVTDHGRHVRAPTRRPADPAQRRRQRLPVRRRRRAVPRPLRDGRAALLARRQHRARPLRCDAPARGRAGAAARQGRRPQRHPGRGGRLDAADLPLEPGRRRHGDRDQRRPGEAHPGRGHRRRGRRTRTAAGERHHGVLVRLRGAARTAPPGRSRPAPGRRSAPTTPPRSRTRWTV